MGKRRKSKERNKKRKDSYSSSSSFYSGSLKKSFNSFDKSSSSNNSSLKKRRKNERNKKEKQKERSKKEPKSKSKSQSKDSSATLKASKERIPQTITQPIIISSQENNNPNDNPNPNVNIRESIQEQNSQSNIPLQQETSLALRSNLYNLKELSLDIYSNFERVDISQIANIQRKMIIYNLPEVNDDEILQYFLTLLNHLTPNVHILNPIVSLEKRDSGFYYIIEVATQDHIEILRNLDNTEWRGYRIRIQRLRNFFRDYNDTRGKNAIPKEIKKNEMESDNKLYMSGIPPSAKEKEIREIVESFGQLKCFNLIKDPSDEDLNRGFCFFEYVSEIVTQRALKGLNNLGMNDKKFKVQRATVNNKAFTILQDLKKNPVDISVKDNQPGKSNFTEGYNGKEPIQQLEIPFYATNSSRVIQMINAITAEDLMDDIEYKEIVEDIRTECMLFGTVLNVEIPRPDKVSSMSGPAVGKIFIKFATIESAKKARFKLSGRKFNKRIVVGSFYPENYFDVREFNYQDKI